MLGLLAFTLKGYHLDRLCAYMGTDFRGYYTSAQIALERGFASVYDHETQIEYQSVLSHRCAEESLPPMARVSMPYLPVFVLLFLPLGSFSFTTSYLIWVGVNLGLLVIYLLRFSKALGVKLNAFHILQWVICLPVISNLYLGQSNIFLVLFLGEFTLALLKNRRTMSGLWLGGLLIKPHTLILLLPGLLVSRNWGVIKGFLLALLMVVGGSIALASLDGVWASVSLAAEFAGPLIQTAPTMINWRALALNLTSIIPDGSAWAAAITGMTLVTGVVMYLWLRRSHQVGAGTVLLILATCAGTLTIAWHSHFYLLMLLIPLLVYLDGRQMLPLSVLFAWHIGAPAWYVLVFLADPSSARNWFGLGMLMLSLYLLVWAACMLLSVPELAMIRGEDDQNFREGHRI